MVKAVSKIIPNKKTTMIQISWQKKRNKMFLYQISACNNIPELYTASFIKIIERLPV